MKKVTGEEVKAAVFAAGITYIQSGVCSLCGGSVGYDVFGPDLYFNSNCNCADFKPREPRTWDYAAQWINMQTDETIQREIMTRFGMTTDVGDEGQGDAHKTFVDMAVSVGRTASETTGDLITLQITIEKLQNVIASLNEKSTDLTEELRHEVETNKVLLQRLAASEAREGILRDTVLLNHNHHQMGVDSELYPESELDQMNQHAIDLPEDLTALRLVMRQHDVVERIRHFNTIAGNTDNVFNVRQAALYMGLQCEELAEKLTRLGLYTPAHTLGGIGDAFKSGRLDNKFDQTDNNLRLGLLDDDIDLAVVTIGSLLAQGADIPGAFAEVHRANMAKVWPDGTMHRDDNGKIVKPEGWVGPDLTPFVCKD